MTSGGLRVVVVEDHELLLDALVAALNACDDLTVVGSVRTIAEFSELITDLEPDVVVTDLQLQDGSGTEVAEIAAEHSDASVLFITGRGDDQGVAAAVSTGSSGFISKSAPLQELVDAIRSVGGGAAVFPAALLRRALDPDLTGVGATLTAKEMEVLELLASGLNASEISAELHVSVHTTRNHVRAILAKLHARSQLEAVVIAVRAGLVEIS